MLIFQVNSIVIQYFCRVYSIMLIIRLVGIIPCAIQWTLLLMCFISSSLRLLIPCPYFTLPPPPFGFPYLWVYFCFASVLNRQQFWLALLPPSLRPWGPRMALSTFSTSGMSNPLMKFIRPFSLNHLCSTSCKYRLFLAATLSGLSRIPLKF